MTAKIDPAGFHIRHAMVRVRDLDRSVAFCTDLLGMSVMRRRVNDDRGEIVAYVGYGNEDGNHALEIVQEHDQPADFRHGNTYGHVALGVPDVMGLSEILMKEGVEFTTPPQAVREGSTHKLAFIKDPDGYEIELTERH